MSMVAEYGWVRNIVWHTHMCACMCACPAFDDWDALCSLLYHTSFHFYTFCSQKSLYCICIVWYHCAHCAHCALLLLHSIQVQKYVTVGEFYLLSFKGVDDDDVYHNMMMMYIMIWWWCISEYDDDVYQNMMMIYIIIWWLIHVIVHSEWALPIVLHRCRWWWWIS